MPESMYDKLGELLSKALDSGVFFEQSSSAPLKNDSAQNPQIPPALSPQNSSFFLKNPPLQVQKAAEFLGITKDMTFEEAKKQYRKKLVRFHPDKNASNQVMKKITEQKTGQILESWKILESWYFSKK